MVERHAITVGVDLASRQSQVCMLDAEGTVIEESRVSTTEAGLRGVFEGRASCRVALEAGTQSPWVSRLLNRLGHEVVVANPRKLRLIYENHTKSDRVDAEYLARVARLDPKLLSPVQHRSEAAQVDLALARSRDALVRCRTALISHVRGAVQALGGRLPSCDARVFASRAALSMPEALRPALMPVVDQIASLSRQLRELQRRMERLADERYPETQRLRQVNGVGPITALVYVLTLERAERFSRSRGVPAFLGLTPRRRDSGDSHPQLRISKAGDPLLRRLLVNCANYILGPFGEDCDLRRWGSAIVARGGRCARKRAVVAVARKLAVLLHRLWVSGASYEPDRQRQRLAVA